MKYSSLSTGPVEPVVPAPLPIFGFVGSGLVESSISLSADHDLTPVLVEIKKTYLNAAFSNINITITQEQLSSGNLIEIQKDTREKLSNSNSFLIMVTSQFNK